MKKTVDTKKLTLAAMLAAIAFLIMVVGRLPITSVDFLKYDPKDAILVISGFLLGPVWALCITVVVALIEMITVSSTGFYGMIMNIFSSAAFVLPAAFVYSRKHSLKAAIIGLAMGCVSAVIVMMAWNCVITPAYMGMPFEQLKGMLLPVFLPFNAIKSVINAALTMLIYKPVSRALVRARLLPKRDSSGKANAKTALWVTLASLFVLATCVLLVLRLRGII